MKLAATIGYAYGRKGSKLQPEYDDTMGLLTKEGAEELKQKSHMHAQASAQNKFAYKTWNCRKCGHYCFFAVIRCTVCESDKIENEKHPVL